MKEKNKILDIIRQSATNIDADSLEHDVRLVEQGLDSLDFISVLFAIQEKYGIKIPEDDINSGGLSTIEKIEKYLQKNG